MLQALCRASLPSPGEAERRSHQAARPLQHPTALSASQRLMFIGRQSGDGEPRTHRAERRFTIAGEEWIVREDLREPAKHTLVFENTIIARRVRDYPEHWRDVSDEELYAPSWSR